MNNKLYFIDSYNNIQEVNIIKRVYDNGNEILITDKGDQILNEFKYFSTTRYFDSKEKAIEYSVSTLKAKIQSNLDKINLIKDENDELYHSINKLNVQKSINNVYTSPK